MPETKHGKCPWCEKHNQTLYFTTGVIDGRLWYDWICGKCISTLMSWELKEE
jgi:hypothetical protein